ncbi:hypothetical protein BV375_16665 [Nostoc sp. 106C]|nr:hypothetical protein BV375_16665 [Nostoc sp. 106C]
MLSLEQLTEQIMSLPSAARALLLLRQRSQFFCKLQHQQHKTVIAHPLMVKMELNSVKHQDKGVFRKTIFSKKR